MSDNEIVKETDANTASAEETNEVVVRSNENTPTDGTMGDLSQEGTPSENIEDGGKAPLYKNPSVIAGVIAVVVIAGSLVYTNRSSVLSFLHLDRGAVVAVINGEKIYNKEYVAGVKMFEQTATMQGADITDVTIKKEIETQALDALVNNVLIRLAAEEANITVEDAEVQEKYDTIISGLGSEDTLRERMKEIGLTEKELRANLKDRILADKYIESVTDIETLSASDEEVNEFYKQIEAGEGELPPLDDIRPQIEAQIIGQKQQDMLKGIIDGLHEKAEIEVKI